MNKNQTKKVKEMRKSLSLNESFTDEKVWRIYLAIKNFRRDYGVSEYEFSDLEIYGMIYPK